MTEDIIVFNINLNNLTFKALSKNGYQTYKLLVKTKSNKNIERLKPFILAEVLKLAPDANVVVRLRPIYDFLQEKNEMKKLDFLMNRLDFPWQLNTSEFESIFTFLENLQGDDEYRVLMIELYLIRLLFKTHNILLQTNNCHICNISYDLEGFDPSYASMVCHSCYSKDMNKKDPTKLQKDIQVLKLLTNFWENKDNKRIVLTLEGSIKDIQKVILTLESLLTNTL